MTRLYLHSSPWPHILTGLGFLIVFSALGLLCHWVYSAEARWASSRPVQVVSFNFHGAKIDYQYVQTRPGPDEGEFRLAMSGVTKAQTSNDKPVKGKGK
jgi:hypothetical protein